MLTASGWEVQDRKDMNLASVSGVAVREFQTSGGPADYLLFLGNQGRLPGCGPVERTP